MIQKTKSNYLKKLVPTSLFAFASLFSNAQVWNIGTEYFIQGSAVEIGIAGVGGYEGADCGSSIAPVQPAGMHFRSNTQYFGFIANPQLDGWGDYNGDFFTPGTPENGWGIEIGGTTGVKLSNNRASPLEIPGSVISTTDINGCLSVIWEGTSTTGASLIYRIEYQMNENDLYYTTKVKLINFGASPANELYYYRNVDPDNNITLSSTYTTTNKIEAQPTAGGCSKAHVSATAPAGGSWDASYLGFAGIDPNFKVGHGGFTNRDGSDMHLGVGFSSAVGATTTSDNAMFITYHMTTIAPGDSAEFKYVVILDAAQAESAINSLFYFGYTGGIGAPPAICSYEVDTVPSCPGKVVNIELLGSNLGDFTWVWTPNTFLDVDTGLVVNANPDVEITYTVTGTPTNPCFTIPVIQQIVVTMDQETNIEFEIATSNPNCLNNDGSVEAINITGGIGPVTVQWTAGPSTPLWDSLFAGIYEITLTDSFGCYADTLVYLSNVSLLTGTVVIDSMAICSHASGMFTVTGVNGDPTYTYDIGLGPNTTGVFSGLADSTYVVGIGDEDGCLVFLPVTIVDTSLLDVSGSMIDEICEGVNGIVTINAAFVNLPATYTLGATTQPTPTFTGLASGTYTIIVNDSYGCVDTSTVTVGDSSNFAGTITVALDPEDCENDQGQAIVTVTGGVPTFSYNLNPGTVNATGIFTGLTSNAYYVVVTDGNNCKDSLAFTILDTFSLDASFVSLINDECFATIGEIVVVANNGVLPYTYTLTPAVATSTTGTFTGLGSGSYIVTVTTPGGGCVDTVQVDIVDLPSTLAATLGNTTDENCGIHNGVFDVNATGGYSPYAYSTNGGVTTQASNTFTGLNNGPFTATIIDSLGCIVTVPVLINEIPIVIDLGPDIIYCNEYTIPADGIGNYSWTTDVSATVLGTGSSYTTLSSGIFVLTTSTTECYDTDTIEITLLEDPKLIVPNVFTPNGDNYNDKFEIQGMFVEAYKLYVFNRWGQLMFESSDLASMWDGKDTGGQDVSEGVYMYIIEYINPCEVPAEQTRKGAVQLFR